MVLSSRAARGAGRRYSRFVSTGARRLKLTGLREVEVIYRLKPV